MSATEPVMKMVITIHNAALLAVDRLANNVNKDIEEQILQEKLHAHGLGIDVTDFPVSFNACTGCPVCELCKTNGVMVVRYMSHHSHLLDDCIFF